MAQQGLDPTFGLKGTCTSHASGFGGWPLGVVLGPDQRPVLVCSAPAQAPLAANQTVVGRRFKEAAVETPRVVSFPPDGRPVTNDPIRLFGPPPGRSFTLARAETEAARIAVLGTETRPGGQALTLMSLEARQPTGTPAVAEWRVSRKVELAGLRGVTTGRCSVGWLLGHPVVVAEDRRPPAGVPRLAIYDDLERKVATVPLSVSARDFDLPRGARPELRVGAVCGVGDGLCIGLSWVVREGTALVQGRASVLRLVRDGTGWALDPAFGAGGLWLATSAEGEVTSADLLVLSPAGQLVVIGHGVSGGVAGVFGAWLDPSSGQAATSSHFAQGALSEPTGVSTDASGRVFACGATRPPDQLPPNDPAQAVVVCLLPDGQPDPSFGTAGVASFRLHGGTYPTAIEATSTGTLLVASALRWGAGSRSGRFHPCVTRLAADGSVDQTFGLAGVCRHDGVAEAELVAVAPTGRVWSAGTAKTWKANASRWQRVLTLSKLATDGGLETAFGNEGIARPRLPFHEHAVRSLVPTAAGGAILSGEYIGRPGASPETGSWIARLTSSGTLDGAFGTGGVLWFPTRELRIDAELADGSLHGWEFFGAAQFAVLRLTASGRPAPGFGPNGAKPITASPLTLPHTCEPNGEWFAPVVGTFDFTSESWSIGLIRCHPKGTIDPRFGANAPLPQADRFVPTASIRNRASLTSDLQWEDREDERYGRHQTLRLADGTFLTLWTLTGDVKLIGGGGGSVPSRALVLVAWTAQGTPRLVPAWDDMPATAIPHPRRTSPDVGWVFRTALLQSDGSVLVGLAGDDDDQAADPSRPPSIRSSAYFCRLLPGSFELDRAFGAGGHIERRLPGEDQKLSADVSRVDYQVPDDLGALGKTVVIGAVNCQTGLGPWFPEFFDRSPDLLADGSVGMVRLI